MSDKPSPKPTPAKPMASATKGNSATPKSKPGGAKDDKFDFLSPPVELDELGRLAHYRVLKVLGKGGMGTVFMAEDTRLHRVVALKVMLPSIAKKAVARQRFIHEARATAAIEHDHIVTIYEVNEANDIPYLAMQVLKGMTLDDWLRAGKTLNVPQIMRIGKEIAKGLAAAHASKLIHRDIKPSNIWLDAANKGRVKILDFGLARPTNEETHLTQEGIIIGTPAFMSPEQARGQNVNERCDLFSLGCVLYRLCAGKLAFSGKDAMSMLLAITSDPAPPLQSLNADVPAAFAKLTHQMLEKKPEDRPESAKFVVQAIQDIERDWIASGKTSAMRPVSETTAILNKEPPLDPALEESAISELELQDTQIPGVKPKGGGRGWLFAGLGAALAAVLSILCCFGVVVATDQGEIKISADDEARPLFGDAGITVLDHHKSARKLKLGTNRLASGGYNVDPAGLPKNVIVEPNQFTLARGDSLEIVVRMVPSTPKNAAPAVELVTTQNAKRLQETWATYLRREVTETNSIGMKMVLIPAGEFTMGSSLDFVKLQFAETKRLDKKLFPEKTQAYMMHVKTEAPAHQVRITRPFYLGMTEVTVGQFTKFIAAKQYTTESEKSRLGGTGIDNGREVRKPEYRWDNPGFAQSPEHPVGNVAWADAEAFCDWLSKKEKVRYRLPTEAEWEYACRAGAATPWSFGDDMKVANNYMWFQFQTKATPMISHPVGKKPANEFGLRDMHGNVQEMCTDYWGMEYYKDSPLEDPTGPKDDPGKGRIARGGSFLELPHTARSAYRNAADPKLGCVNIGFRVVREASE